MHIRDIITPMAHIPNKSRDSLGTFGSSRQSDVVHGKETRLRKQMSSEIKQTYSGNLNYTPNTNKPKATLIHSKPNFKEDTPEEEYTDSSYMTAERGYTRKTKNIMQKEVNEYEHSSKGKGSYGRSTITPSRYGIRNQSKIFKLGPEAFQQPTSDEQDNLIVNLEDIVKEEHIINKIQDNMK